MLTNENGMTISTRCIFMILAAGLQYVHCSAEKGPLFLTPYINQCLYDQAKNLSKVQLFQLIADANAYSGYITVDNENKSHLFFLFVQAKENKQNAPLLLWTQGGPGLSALFGQFLQNGPVAFELPGNFTKRSNTLHNEMNVIYLDVPVGAGFSFTTDQLNGYSKSLEEIADHVVNFLEQFFKLFEEYKNRDLYLAGESYGGRYSVAIAHKLITETLQLSPNLKGVIGGNGFLGPVLDTADSSEFLYEASMLTEKGKQDFAAQFQMMKQLTNASVILHLLFRTIFTSTNKSTPTKFQELTLYNDHASPLYTERPRLMLVCYGYLNSSYIRNQLHAGEETRFEYSNQLLQYNLASDWLRDITNLTQLVLNKTRVLLYFGQLDALFPSVKQRQYIEKLTWSQVGEFRSANRCTWQPHDKYYGFAGYIKEVTNFTEAVILGMSHFGAAEKPDEIYYLITKFTKQQLFCTRSADVPKH